MIRAFPVLLMVVAGGLAATPSTNAQAPQAIGVRDRADLFSRGAVSDATAQLRKVYDQTKLQVAIETVESLDGKPAQVLATANARSLKVHGLYVLLAKKERKIAAEPSDRAKSVFTAARCEAIVQAFADGLRANKADDGLARAVASITQDTGGSAVKPTRASAPRLAASDPAGVYDNARMFTSGLARDADGALKDLEKRSGNWQAVVETIDSLDGRDIQDVLREHAKAKEVRGVYVLIARDDRKFRVERSNSAAEVFTQARIDAITKGLGDGFKAGNFDQGLKSVVDEVRQSVEARSTTVSTARASRPNLAPQPGPGASPTPAPPGPKVQAPADKPLLPGPGDPTTTQRDGTTTTRLGPPPAPTPTSKPAGGIPRPLIFLLLAGAVIVGIFLVRKLFGGGPAPQQPSFMPVNSPRANNPPPGFGPAVGGQPMGMGGPAGPMVGGQPGYGPNPGGGMGGFVKGVLGGAAGAVVGNMIYDQFGRPRHAQAGEIHPGHPQPMMPGQTGGDADGYHPENAAVGGWDAPAPPSDDWNGTTGGAEGGWDDPGSNQGGGDWGNPGTAEPQGDWGADQGGGGGGGDGGDWGGSQDNGGGGDGGDAGGW